MTDAKTERRALNQAERAYLGTQRLARLATVDPAGQPQVNPVGFRLQDDGTVLVGGRALPRTKKWRNLTANPRVALVVDDLASVRPWHVRGVEIRGDAELEHGRFDMGAWTSSAVIRIRPRRIHSWGLDDE